MLSGSVVIDVVIGLILLYVLLAAGASALYEIGTGLFAKKRGRMLMDHLQAVFAGEDDRHKAVGVALFEQFRKHALITSLRQGGNPKNTPAYITTATFVQTLLDVVERSGVAAPASPSGGTRSIESFRTTLAAMPGGPVKESLTALLNAADGKLNVFEKNIEGWYKDICDRMSGWYKRHAQFSLLVIGVVLAVLLNADTIMVVKILATSPAARQAAVAAATERVKAAAEAKDGKEEQRISAAMATLQTDVANSGLPIWWSDDPASPNHTPWSKWGWGEFGSKIVGMLITALAISLGGGYWFDLMSKVVNLRASGPKPVQGK